MQHNYKEYQEKSSDDNILSKITAAVQELQEADEKIEQLLEDLKTAQNMRQNLSEFVLPTLMEEAEQEKIRTKDGTTIEILNQVSAKIPKLMEAKAYKWLDDNGDGNIIKREFTINFGKNEEDKVHEFEEHIKDIEPHLNMQNKKSIHNQTLGAFVRGKLRDGEEIPFDIFGVRSKKITKLS